MNARLIFAGAPSGSCSARSSHSSLGAVLLPLLRRLRVFQHAYESAPQSHQSKTGTPTMGGLLSSFGRRRRCCSRRARRWSRRCGLLSFSSAPRSGGIDDASGVRLGTQSRLARAHEVPGDRAARGGVPARDRRVVRVLSTRRAFSRRSLFAGAPHWVWLAARHRGDHRNDPCRESHRRTRWIGGRNDAPAVGRLRSSSQRRRSCRQPRSVRRSELGAVRRFPLL